MENIVPTYTLGAGEDTNHDSGAAFHPASLPAPHFLDADGGLQPAQRSGPNKWSPMLVMDLAIGVDDLETILTTHNLTKAELDRLFEVPTFRHEVAMMRREVRENGVTFGKKARIQAEQYLETLDLMMANPDTPPSVRLDIFKTLTKLAGLEPKNKEETQVPQVNIQINM